MNPILLSLGISAAITAISIGLEYAIRAQREWAHNNTELERGDARMEVKLNEMRALLHKGERVIPSTAFEYHDVSVMGDTQPRLIKGARVASRRCEYCKTVQNVGAHCLNCGAPLE